MNPVDKQGPQSDPQLSKQEVLGASRLVIQAVIGVTDVVEAMHSNISRVAPPIGRSRSRRARGLSGQIYSSVRGVTRTVGFGLEAAHRLLPNIRLKSSHHRTREALVSRLNGVFGDHLESSANPLAIRMSLRQEGQTILSHGQRGPAPLPHHSRPVVMVHGLCMNDLQWRVDGHDHGEQLARDCGMAPLYLHYNTGRRISANGRDLAELLETMVEHWPCAIDQLTLIGHSMGGLVIRSACHYGQAHGHHWLERLNATVLLGSPHHGAPLERVGNWAGKLLEASPYSAPIARLGRLRSAGIQDLRHGNIIDDGLAQQTRPASLPDHVTTHVIAASKSPVEADTEGKLKGDGLVPIKSALGHHPDPDAALDVPEHQMHLVLDTGHLELLSSPEVYRVLKLCVSPSSESEEHSL